MSDQRILFRIEEPVEAELVVRTPSGIRPPKAEELHLAKLIGEGTLFDRRQEIMRGVFGPDWSDNEDGDDTISGIRYLLDYAGIYAHLPLPDEALDVLRRLVGNEVPR